MAVMYNNKILSLVLRSLLNHGVSASSFSWNGSLGTSSSIGSSTTMNDWFMCLSPCTTRLPASRLNKLLPYMCRSVRAALKMRKHRRMLTTLSYTHSTPSRLYSITFQQMQPTKYIVTPTSSCSVHVGLSGLMRMKRHTVTAVDVTRTTRGTVANRSPASLCRAIS